MFPGVARTGLTLPKVLGGIQKTLNIANQVIPLYVQVKPIIKNAQSAFSVAKGLLATPSTNQTTPSNLPSKAQTQDTKKQEEPPVTYSNNPVFFL